MDEDGSDELVELATGKVLDTEPDEYIVILDVAEGSEFPTKRARHARQARGCMQRISAVATMSPRVFFELI